MEEEINKLVHFSVHLSHKCSTTDTLDIIFSDETCKVLISINMYIFFEKGPQKRV